MKIALILAQEQAEKNALIFTALQQAAAARGHTAENFGSCYTIPQAAFLSAVLLAGGGADFIVTACETSIFSTMAFNAMPGVRCGPVATPLDAYMFTQINTGNAISLALHTMPAGNLPDSLSFLFEKLLEGDWGAAEPAENPAFVQKNRAALIAVKQNVHVSLSRMLDALDPAVLQQLFGDQTLLSRLRRSCTDTALIGQIETILHTGLPPLSTC